MSIPGQPPTAEDYANATAEEIKVYKEQLDRYNQSMALGLAVKLNVHPPVLKVSISIDLNFRLALKK